MNSGVTFPIIFNSVEIMTPFLLAALGGLLTELVGMLNIALEGMILLGAFLAVVLSAWTGSLFWGVVLACLLVMLAALFFGTVTIYLRANVFITGLATNLFAGGIVTVLSHHIFSNKGVLLFPELPALPRLRIPGLDGVPVAGEILSGHSPFAYLAWVLVALVFVFLYRTPLGFHLRGTGSNPDAIKAAGLKPRLYQLGAIVFSGLACALAGAGLSLSVGAYVPNISAGRGWTALVIIYLGNRTPYGILGAAFFFALAESFSNWLQGVTALPSDYILAIPYGAALVILMGAAAFRRKRASA